LVAVAAALAITLFILQISRRRQLRKRPDDDCGGLQTSEPQANAYRGSTMIEPNAAAEASYPTHHDIAQLAYSYWQERGRTEGSPEIDWFRAEQQCLRERPIHAHYTPENMTISDTRLD
jgi:hypothetical protein